MKSKINTIKVLAIVATLVFTATVAMAHTNHDHSTVPYKWELSKIVKTKIEKNIQTSTPSTLIGLTGFEQKALTRYNIQVGNKFNSVFNGVNLLLERTSAGVRILDANPIKNIFYESQVPVKKINSIFSQTSMEYKNHAGHNHATLPYEWTFDRTAQKKIVNAMLRKKDYVGLDRVEQSLLREYDIKSGNMFQTTIDGYKFLVEMTSAGVKIVNHVEMENVNLRHQHDMKI